jgi:hypothetical protein
MATLSRARLSVAVSAVAIALTSCSFAASTPASGDPDGVNVATVAQIEGVATIATSQADVSFEVRPIPVGSIALPETSLSPGVGVDVSVSGSVTEPVTVRLHLADRPSSDAMPMAWHVAGDGMVVMVTGMWDEGAGELVVTTTDFSGLIPDWLNPVDWIGGAIDMVADAITGRTDPPGCGEAPPEWASYAPPGGTGTVHSCFQSNIDSGSAEARAELFFKSNRRTFQVVTIPPTRAYVWVEGQPDWVRPVLAWLTGSNNNTNVLLPGGQSMSYGFAQPVYSTTAYIDVYPTPGTILLDGLFATLGILTGASTSDLTASAVAVHTCILGSYGVDATRLDLLANLDLDTFLSGMLKCSLETRWTPAASAASVCVPPVTRTSSAWICELVSSRSDW